MTSFFQACERTCTPLVLNCSSLAERCALYLFVVEYNENKLSVIEKCGYTDVANVLMLSQLFLYYSFSGNIVINEEF